MIMRFDAEMQKKQRTLIDDLSSAEFRQGQSRDKDKSQFIEMGVTAGLWGKDDGVEIDEWMKDAVNEMKEAIGTMEEFVAEQSMRTLVDECAAVQLGVGTDTTNTGEFLLDIGDGHAYCACGLNRALWIGQKFETPPGINGLAGSRRLSTVDDDAKHINVCGEAFERAKVDINDHKREIVNTGEFGKQILKEYQDKKGSEQCVDVAVEKCKEEIAGATSTTASISVVFAALVAAS